MYDNGLIGRVHVIQGNPSVRRLQRILDTYVETLPVSTVDIVDTDTDAWSEIMATARQLVDHNLTSTTGALPVVEVVIERKRRGGRPVKYRTEEERRLGALKRAEASKTRREKAGRLEVRYYVAPEIREMAERLIAERSLSGMSELIETLVTEASTEKTS